MLSNFLPCFDYPVEDTNNGRIYFKQKHFANFWRIVEWSPEVDGKWLLNRDMLALDMDLPNCEPFDSLEKMVEYLEDWYIDRSADISKL